MALHTLHLRFSFTVGAFRVRSFGMIQKGITDPRSLWTRCIKGADESTLGKDFFGCFDAPWSEWSWISDPFSDYPKGMHSYFLLSLSLQFKLKLTYMELCREVRTWWYFFSFQFYSWNVDTPCWAAWNNREMITAFPFLNHVLTAIVALFT